MRLSPHRDVCPTGGKRAFVLAAPPVEPLRNAFPVLPPLSVIKIQNGPRLSSRRSRSHGSHPKRIDIIKGLRLGILELQRPVAPASLFCKYASVGHGRLRERSSALLIASMSLKSTLSEVTVNLFQVAPPSSVRRTVLFESAAQQPCR